MEGASPAGGRRQARSIRNDTRILDAAFALLVEQGWPGLLFPAVSSRAGLSIRPVRDRFSDRSELAAAVWTERAFPPFLDAVAGLQVAFDLVRKKGALEASALVEALGPFRQPDAHVQAAIVLIIVSGYDPMVRGALDSTLLPHLRDWLTPQPGALSAADAARRAYLLNIALGLLLEGRQRDSSDVSLTDDLSQLAEALAADQPPQAQPSTGADHLDAGAEFDTGDPDWDALLQAVLDQVGTRGYDAATTAAIARASGHTEGFLFGRYATKQEMFFDATQRMVGRATQLNADYQAGVAARYSVGMSEAVMMREFMRPGRERIRIIGLEQYRLSWYDPKFRSMVNQAQEPVIAAYVAMAPEDQRARRRATALLELARGSGPVAVAQLVPEAWSLPYDVVTIPLLDGTG